MTAAYPLLRLRRGRGSHSLRELLQENQLSPADLIQPLFIHDKANSYPIPAMPGIKRTPVKQLGREAARLYALGIRAVALFPVIPQAKKNLTASEAWNPSGLVPQSVQAIKDRCPDMVVITDVALDPYTKHGQDGLLNRNGEVDNDKTVAALVHQAVCQADAGADIVAPSDMMDGRVGAIRQALEKNGHKNTLILSYAVKYASHLYGPFRHAIGSAANLRKADKRTYQMNPANSEEAQLECTLDIQEGADILMVKPGLPYLDIVQRIKQQSSLPVFVYVVSGEYAMIKAAADQGWLDEKNTVLETLMCCKRAGAQSILTYHAAAAAAWLND